MSTNRRTMHDPRCSAQLTKRAFRKYGTELHRLLIGWLVDHPDGKDPVAFVELEGDRPGLSQKIRTRDDALATLRGEGFNPDLIDALAQSSPVPRGSVDLIVSTASWLALERVTPRAEGSS